MSMRIISALVENKPGVLTRISGMFTRRGINIQSLTVSPCERDGLSRMTIVTMSDDRELEKAEKQLNTLVEVVKVSTLHKSSSIVRDLCLVRINVTDVRRREAVMQMVSASGAKIVDVSLNALTVEIVDEPRKIDKFVEMVRGYGIKQLLRTGVTAIAMDGANSGSANGGSVNGGLK